MTEGVTPRERDSVAQSGSLPRGQNNKRGCTMLDGRDKKGRRSLRGLAAASSLIFGNAGNESVAVSLILASQAVQSLPFSVCDIGWFYVCSPFRRKVMIVQMLIPSPFLPDQGRPTFAWSCSRECSLKYPSQRYTHVRNLCGLNSMSSEKALQLN